MVNPTHFSQLYPGKQYKASQFDNSEFDNFKLLKLSKQGAKASIERMASKLFCPYQSEFEQMVNLADVSTPGWDYRNLKYGTDGWYPHKPTAKVLMLDIETMVQLGNYPVMAACIDSTGNWYFWKTPKPGQLIDLPDDTLVIAHNASFDATGIAGSYAGIKHGCWFVDTMTMANSIWGFCSHQTWVESVKHKKNVPLWGYKGFGKSNYKSLKATYLHLYPQAELEEIDKTLRDIFVNATDINEVYASFNELAEYNCNDIKITLRVLHKMYPIWLAKNPSLITLVGNMLSSSYRIPLTPDWDDWIAKVDQVHSDTQAEINQKLQLLADNWVKTGYQADNPWHQHLDWTIKPKARVMQGYPEWYRKEMMAKGCITLRSRVAHYLLCLKYDNSPVYYKCGYRSDAGKIPHPSGTGNVGYLFSKDLVPLFKSGMLVSANPDCQQILDKAISLTYWTSTQKRVKDCKVINNWTIPQTGGGTVTGRVTDPLWLTTCDPKPHLIGSELKSRITAPSGYKLITADFSSQEMRIAWTLGDSLHGYMGASEMSRQNILGSKADGTDAHSRLAKKLGELLGCDYKRQDAKVIGFSMLYMAGVKAVASYIRQILPHISQELAKSIAKDALEYRRGKVRYLPGNEGREYVGGTDSDAYNCIDQIANQEFPRTPLLCREMSNPLCPRYVKSDFYTTRANWVVQGSARDQLDCLSVALTFMLKLAKLEARLIWSRHDEVILLAPESEVKLVAELMQQAHAFTWAAFHQQLGLLDIPSMGLLFDSIDVDTVCRKEVDLSLQTPSNSTEVADGYSILPSEFTGLSDWSQLTT